MIQIIAKSKPFECDCIVTNERAIPFLKSILKHFVDWKYNALSTAAADTKEWNKIDKEKLTVETKIV